MSGLYQLPFKKYRAIKAVNASSLKDIRHSALHYKTRQGVDAEGDALDVGTGTHALVLEPDKYDDEIAVFTGTRRGKVWDEFRRASTEKTIITAKQDAEVHQMGASILRHEEAAALLALPSTREGVITWTDPTTGLLCKARPDWYGLLDGLWTLVDLKTMQSIVEHKVQNTVKEYGYDLQLAFYGDGLIANSLPVEAVKILAVQKPTKMDQTCDVGIFDMQQWIQDGRNKYEKAMETLIDCRESGKWPGRVPKTVVLPMPEYAACAGPALTLDGVEI